PTGLALPRLEGYRALLIPEAENIGKQEAEILTSYGRRFGRKAIVYSESPIDPGKAQRRSGRVLFDFWNNYSDAGRQRKCAPLAPYRTARLQSSDPLVNVIRYVKGDEQVLHLLNYNYDATEDRVVPSRRLRIRVPWQPRSLPGDPGGHVACMLLSLAREERLECAYEGGETGLEIPHPDLHGPVVVG